MTTYSDNNWQDKNSIHTNTNSVFSTFVSLTLIAYISRIAEIFPILSPLRINLLLFVITLILFFSSGAKDSFRLKNNFELKLILCFFLVALLAVPFSIWRGHAFQTWKSTLFINLMILVYCQTVINHRNEVKRIVRVIVISSTLLLIGLYTNPQVQGERISTTFTYDSNDIALLFSFTLPIILSYFATAKTWGKLFSFVLIVGIILGIIKTGSRGGMIAFAASLTIILFTSGVQIKFLSKLIVVSVIILFILSPRGENMRNRFSILLSGQDYNITHSDSIAGGRLAIWKSGLKLLKENLIFGVGAGNSSTAMGLEFGSSGWKTAHNSYLQAALELGIFGLFIYLLMLCTIMKNCKIIIQQLKGCHDDVSKNLLSLTHAIRIALVAYMIAAFFLSQAYSVVVPLALGLTSKLKLFTTTPTPLLPSNKK